MESPTLHTRSIIIIGAGGIVNDAHLPAYRLAGFPLVTFILVGLTWAFWQHLFSGLRHLVLDTGAGYELRVNKFWSFMTMAASVFMTAVTWALFEGLLK